MVERIDAEKELEEGLIAINKKYKKKLHHYQDQPTFHYWQRKDWQIKAFYTFAAILSVLLAIGFVLDLVAVILTLKGDL